MLATQLENGRATHPVAGSSAVPGTASVLTRPCPTCGSSDAIRSVSTRPTAEESPFSVVQDGWKGFFKTKVFFTYCRCAHCGLLYAPRYLSSEAMAALYSEMAENMADVPVSLVEKTQRGYFDFFRGFAPQGGNYLEVGPDIGLFTQFVARECRFDDHLLFEPNRIVLAELSQRMNGRKHQVQNGFLNFDTVPDGSVSAVAMIHVLDHLLEPLETLRNLRRKMSQGGLILIVVHDESSFLARILGRQWPAYCLQHPQVFRPATLRALLERAGFRVCATEASVNHFPLVYLAKHLAFALKLGRLPTFLPESLSVPLKLGNFITAAAVDD